MAIWSYTLALDKFVPLERRGDNDSILEEFFNFVVVISIAYLVIYARILYKDGIDAGLDAVNNRSRLLHLWKL